MKYATGWCPAGMRLSICLLAGGLAAGCVATNANPPAEDYATRRATMADVIVFSYQGAMEPKFRQLHEGMSREEVIRILGKPDQIDDGAEANAPETLHYLGRLLSGWSWDRANYKVELREGKVVQFSRGAITKQPPPEPPSSWSSINWGHLKWGK